MEWLTIRERLAEGMHVVKDVSLETSKFLFKPSKEQLAALNTINGVRGIVCGVALIGGAFAVGHWIIGALLLANWGYEAYLHLVLNAGGWHAEAQGEDRMSWPLFKRQVSDGVASARNRWEGRRFFRRSPSTVAA